MDFLIFGLTYPLAGVAIIFLIIYGCFTKIRHMRLPKKYLLSAFGITWVLCGIMAIMLGEKGYESHYIGIPLVSSFVVLLFAYRRLKVRREVQDTLLGNTYPCVSESADKKARLSSKDG